jgi:hypothetical protein
VGKKTSVYLPDDLAEAIRASGKSIPALIRLGLEAGERGRADRLADEVERMLRMLQDEYTFIPRERTADQGLPVIPDCRAQAIGCTGIRWPPRVAYLSSRNRRSWVDLRVCSGR